MQYFCHLVGQLTRSPRTSWSPGSSWSSDEHGRHGRHVSNSHQCCHGLPGHHPEKAISGMVASNTSIQPNPKQNKSQSQFQINVAVKMEAPCADCSARGQHHQIPGEHALYKKNKVCEEEYKWYGGGWGNQTLWVSRSSLFRDLDWNWINGRPSEREGASTNAGTKPAQKTFRKVSLR